MPQSSTARAARVRVSRACESCRDKKSKCDGVTPVCGRCRSKSLECYYEVTKRVKTQQVMKELATKVAHYESVLNNSTFPHHTASAQVDTDPDISESTASIPPLDEDVVDAVFDTTSHSEMNATTAISEQSAVDSLSLPSRALVERGIEAFFEGTAVLFTLFDEDEISLLLEHMYQHQDTSRNKAALLQLCAAAAVGCRYLPHRFDTGTHAAFVSLAKEGIEDCIEVAPLSAMRVLVLLAMYFTFEKRTAALMYVDMGLRLAKLYRHKTMINEQPLPVGQRVFGSLVFLDCWLCSAMGHLPTSQTSEVHLSLIMLGAADAPVVTVVQFEMIKIALLSASILQDVYHARFVSSLTITSYKNQLQQWLVTLPEYMRLDRLIDLDERPTYLRPIMLLHLLYMNTVILVYRRILIDIAALGRHWSDPELFHKTQLFLEPCVWTARQVAKLLEITLSQGQVIQTCWMVVDATYSTCNLLLYSVASRLVHRDLSEQVDHDMAAAKQCIEVLTFCANADELASQHLTDATALSDSIARIHAILVPGASSAISQEQPEDTNGQLLRLISLASRYLMHPFDGGFRRELGNMHDTLTRLAPERTNSDMMLSPGPDFKPLPSDADQATQWNDNIFLNDIMHQQDFMGRLRQSAMGKNADRGLYRLSFESAQGLLFGS